MIVWALGSLERRGLAESALTLENLMGKRLTPASLFLFIKIE